MTRARASLAHSRDESGKPRPALKWSKDCAAEGEQLTKLKSVLAGPDGDAEASGLVNLTTEKLNGWILEGSKLREKATLPQRPKVVAGGEEADSSEAVRRVGKADLQNELAQLKRKLKEAEKQLAEEASSLKATPRADTVVEDLTLTVYIEMPQLPEERGDTARYPKIEWLHNPDLLDAVVARARCRRRGAGRADRGVLGWRTSADALGCASPGVGELLRGPGWPRTAREPRGSSGGPSS